MTWNVTLTCRKKKGDIVTPQQKTNFTLPKGFDMFLFQRNSATPEFGLKCTCVYKNKQKKSENELNFPYITPRGNTDYNGGIKCLNLLVIKHQVVTNTKA